MKKCQLADIESERIYSKEIFLIEVLDGRYEKSQDLYILIDVYRIGTTFTFYHVSPNNYYKFYLNEYFKNK